MGWGLKWPFNCSFQTLAQAGFSEGDPEMEFRMKAIYEGEEREGKEGGLGRGKSWAAMQAGQSLSQRSLPWGAQEWSCVWLKCSEFYSTILLSHCKGKGVPLGWGGSLQLAQILTKLTAGVQKAFLRLGPGPCISVSTTEIFTITYLTVAQLSTSLVPFPSPDHVVNLHWSHHDSNAFY